MASDVAADAAAALPGGTGQRRSPPTRRRPPPPPSRRFSTARRSRTVPSSGGRTTWAPSPATDAGAPRRRVRDRLARRIVAGQRSTVVRPVLEPLSALHRQSHPKADLALLQRAYDVAEAAHARAEAQER